MSSIVTQGGHGHGSPTLGEFLLALFVVSVVVAVTQWFVSREMRNL